MGNESSGLLLSITQDTGGRRSLAILDPMNLRRLIVPLSFAREVRSWVSLKAIRLLSTASRAFGPGTMSLTIYIDRPERTADLFNEDFVSRLASDPRFDVRDGGRVTLEEYPEFMLEADMAGASSIRDLRRCVERSLHQWRRVPHQREWQCTRCRGLASLLQPEARQSLRIAIVGSRLLPWKKRGTRRMFDLIPERTSVKVRVLLHTEGLRDLEAEDRKALRYLIAMRNRGLLELRRTESHGKPPADLLDIPVLRAEQRTGGEQHLDVVAKDDGGRIVETLGDSESLKQLIADLGGGDRGMDRASAAMVGAWCSNLTLTGDRTLLMADGFHVGEAQLLRPRVAVPLIALLARYRDRVPIDTGLSMPGYQFHEAMAFALVPELFAMFAALSGAKRELKQARLPRLTESLLSRMVTLSSAEDEVGFLVHFPQGVGRPDRVIYHLEFGILQAQALLEGTRAIVREVYELPRRAEWQGALPSLESRNPQLTRFLREDAGRDISKLVGAIRHPLAHDQHWWKQAGDEEQDPASRFQIITGASAEGLVSAIARLGQWPDDWGITENMHGRESDFEVRLDPYVFMVLLNIHLRAYVASYLRHLLADLSPPQEVISRTEEAWIRAHPWLAPYSRGIVALLSWPPLDL